MTLPMEASQNGHNSHNGSSASSALAQCGGNLPQCQASSWPSSAEMERVRGLQELHKMKPCHGGHCGVYDGISVPIVNGHCQQPSHGRLYRAYMPQHQQQQPPHPMAVRTMHHHHYHPSSVPACHPHPAPSYLSAATGGPMPQPQQMRSMVMNHYQTNPGYASYHHHSSSSGSNYYSQAVSSNANVPPNGSCMEYSHPGLGHGVPVTSAPTTAPQYAQQRTINTLPSSLSNSLRPMQNGHPQSKVMNPSQAALYQNAYHQYTQYIQQQHGMMNSGHHPHHHQNGPTGAPTMTMAPQPQQQQQQQARLLQFMSRMGPNVPPPHHHHNHGYQASCHSHMMPNCLSHQVSQPPPHPDDVCCGQEVANPSSGSSCSSNIGSTAPGGPVGNVKSGSTETKVETEKRSCSRSGKEGSKMRSRTGSPVIKLGSVRIKCGSPEKVVKLKAVKSANRQPKLVLGRKKKTSATVSIVSSGGKKLRSSLKSSCSSTGGVGGSEGSSSMKKLSSGNHRGDCASVDKCSSPRPPPGFEHLTRPAFPIEMCDPTLLGTLYGCQLPREPLMSDVSESESPTKYFCEDIRELLPILPCCEKGVIDMHALWETDGLLECLEHDDEKPISDDWDGLNKEIRSVVDEWTEELTVLATVQNILHDGLALKSINLFKHF